MTILPLFLDIEASSLASASYPIEIAWTKPNNIIESYLISPAGIASWSDWSATAQKLHGISQFQLLEQGKPPRWVVHRMNEQLLGQTLYSDNPDYDTFWLAESYKKSGGLTPNFVIKHIDNVLSELLWPHYPQQTQINQRIKQIKQLAREQANGQHRAAVDVMYLQKLYQLAQSCVADSKLNMIQG